MIRSLAQEPDSVIISYSSLSMSMQAERTFVR